MKIVSIWQDFNIIQMSPGAYGHRGEAQAAASTGLGFCWATLSQSLLWYKLGMLTVLKIGLWSCSKFTSCKLYNWKTMNRFKTFISIKANQIRTLESWPFDSLRQLKITARATHAAITRPQVPPYPLHALWSYWALFRCLSWKNT